MDSPFSSSEREALSTFVKKVIDDVDKVASLFEARGADASHLRGTQAGLRLALDSLKPVERLEFRLQARVPGAL